MAAQQLDRVIRQMRRTALLRDYGDVTDGQLLERFIDRQDEAAFEALVRRHGAMVLSVCRRVLGNTHDAEDAFQATFLVLVHKAASLGMRELVGNWLYGVAYRTALEARTVAARRRVRERQVSEMPEPAMPEAAFGGDLRLLLDRELSQLPDKYRVSIVLCDLEGRPRKDVARQLGVPESTVSGRLTTARRLLGRRLTRQGITLGGGVAALLQSSASACVPAPLVLSTVKAAALVAAGQAAAGAVSAHVVALAKGVLKAMFLTKMKTVGSIVLTVFVFAGVGLVGQNVGAPTANGRQAPPAAQEKPAAPAADKQDKPPSTDRPAVAKDKAAAALFTTVRYTGSGSVSIRQTGKEMINGAAVQPGDVQNGVLTLDGAEDFDIEVKELSAIQHDGSGPIEAKDLKSKRLAVTSKGSGAITAKGTADVQEITLNASGAFKGKDLKGKEGTVRIGGSADAVVHVTEKLKGIVSGSGTVKYVGTPKVEMEITGSGEVRPLREGEDAANLQAAARAQAAAASAQAKAAAARAQGRRVPGFLQDQARLGAVLEIPDPILMDQLDLPRGQGVVVRDVNTDSAAAKAGIKANDILLELNGKAVPSEQSEFAKLLEGIKAKTPVGAVVLRKGKKETIKELTLPEPGPNR